MSAHLITVEASAHFLPEESNPSADYFVFAYRVRITNSGREPVQLLRRHWVITDASGRVEEVEGPGVVGEQPRLREGQCFEYTSFCPLPTPTGHMRGEYLMIRDDGSEFLVEIPAFDLIHPKAMH